MQAITARFALLFVTLVLVACGAPSREEVIERHPGGEKRVVVRYEGAGTAEQLVERHTYDVTGDLVLLEDLVSGTSLSWADLRDDLDTVEGLQSALDGRWYSYSIHQNDNGSALTLLSETDFTADTRETTWHFTLDDDKSNTPNSSVMRWTIEYLPGRQFHAQGVPDKEYTPTYAIPLLTYRNTVTFLSKDSIKMDTTVIIQGRLEVDLEQSDVFYRDQTVAEAMTTVFPPPTQAGVAHENRQQWQQALMGDDRLRNEFPAYYEQQTGFDPTLNLSTLRDNHAALGGDCIRFAGLSPTQADAIAAQADRLNLRRKIAQESGQVFIGHSVQVNNVASRNESRRIIQRLNRVGLGDAFYFTDAHGKPAVALGIFATYENADKVRDQALRASVSASIESRTTNGTITVMNVALPTSLSPNDLLPDGIDTNFDTVTESDCQKD